MQTAIAREMGGGKHRQQSDNTLGRPHLPARLRCFWNEMRGCTHSTLLYRLAKGARKATSPFAARAVWPAKSNVRCSTVSNLACAFLLLLPRSHLGGAPVRAWPTNHTPATQASVIPLRLQMHVDALSERHTELLREAHLFTVCMAGLWVSCRAQGRSGHRQVACYCTLARR